MAYDWVQSQKSPGFLPMAKDLIALSAAWVREAELPDLCGTRVSIGDFLCSGTSPNPPRSPNLTLSSSFLGKVVFTCVRDLSVLQPRPSSVAWAKDRGVQGETGSTRCGGRGVAEVPACSERKRGAGAASLWSALPFISLAGPTPSFANSVQCSLKCSLQRVLIPFGCILKSHWKRLSLLETDPSLIAKCGWVVSAP